MVTQIVNVQDPFDRLSEVRQAQSPIATLERLEREAYLRQPVLPGEFDGWEAEQAWGDE